MTDALKNLMTRGVADVIDRDHLARALSSGRKLRVKLGIDPTSPDLHLGHAVLLRKLRQFQDLGHKAVLIIGDFTATIGDPSGRDKTRPPLTERQVKDNMKKYLAQVGKIVNIKTAEVRKNSEWHKKDGLASLLALARTVSYQQVIKRSDFQKRMNAGEDITLIEILYPLLQGYDSVAIKADVELGGTDQTFNLLMGRRVQRHFKQPEQNILTVPLIEGTDGARKMSKSYGNYIGVAEKPAEMFGKLMAIPDALMAKYYETLTDLEPSHGNPRDQKLTLAETIVAWLHSAAAGKKAREEWITVFSKKELPEKIEGVIVPHKTSILDALRKSGIKSNSEGVRLLKQGAIRKNGAVVQNEKEMVNDGDILKIGKKKIVEIKGLFEKVE
ncbi:MAG: tyrosine--tRNA ligase [Candidatus Brennerbacteria bacterium]|nr:tyrosine--tRNA ligase [Candidatus Brennerbacteria bacterium]